MNLQFWDRSAKEMTALRKTRQHSAVKHPKQSKRVSAHPSICVGSTFLEALKLQIEEKRVR